MPVALVHLIIAGVSRVDLRSLGASSVASHWLLADAYLLCPPHPLCASGPIIALAFVLYRRLTSPILAPYAWADRNGENHQPSVCLARIFAE